MSKQVVREALRQLAALGALQVGQGRTTRVSAAPDAGALARFWRLAVGGTREGLAEAVELRRMIEPQVARLAALRADAAGLEAMRAILARMEAAIGDVPRWIQADLDFHEQLGRLSGNGLVWLQVRGLRPVVEEVMRRFNDHASRSHRNWRATFDRHRLVLDALAARSPAAAEAAMLAHFAAAEDAIAAIFPAAPTPGSKQEETG